ncbi:uncharacterized protein N7469_006347 [Penicillium citrinum]|uniref:Enoyl-CoA hydratase n=1 Tax=Penicillium citrinum TaxID=5077 RepID=A0A9W9TP02_PENCI|nr:uncharacterized protein N7469_006347 [Penicillium citrinum]KAJ5231759.1 hypothetical protein N7469_006347 [Penicillium citrinum]
MTTSSIITTLARRRTGTIANITITRPSKLNALNTPLLEKLPQQVEAVTTQNADLLGIVLTGAGPKSFVGGADIAEMANLNSPAAARGFITKVHRACKSVRDCPVPVIARVNGYALGAGCELAAACDLRVAMEKIVEQGALDEAVEGWLSQLEKNGPSAVRKQKALMRTWENVSLDEAIQAGVAAFEESFMAKDGEVTEPARMLSAFFQKKSR